MVVWELYIEFENAEDAMAFRLAIDGILAEEAC
jgi:hypothetical protein